MNHIGKLGFTEYLWNSHSLPIFRSDLIELWQKSDVHGFTTRPIHVTGWYKRPKIHLPPSIPSYFQLEISNTVKLLEPKAINSPCPNCGFVRYDFPKIGNYLPKGIQIDVSSWGGTDFFTSVGYNILFCTRRVVEVTLQAGYSKSITFIKVDDWERWEEFNIKKWDKKSYEAYLEKFFIRDVRDLSRLK